MRTSIVLAVLALATMAAHAGEAAMNVDAIHWLGHDAFRLDGPPVVYIDPYELAGGVKADLILITHAHSDHLSPADVARVRGPNTVVVGPQEVADKLAGVRVVAPGDAIEVAGVRVQAVPAYNTNKKFHPEADGKVGFVISFGAFSVYHAGDTDAIPEMAALAPDVALLPVSGTYVMTAPEAADAARSIKPTVAIPMHYGSIVGSEADAKKFAKALEGSGIQVIIKAKE